MRALLIAEKPSLMKELKAVYDKFGHKDNLTFKTFAGHTMTLKQPEDYKEEWKKWNLHVLPMVPDQFLYTPTNDKIAMFNEIKNEVLHGGYDYIINGCDPGREGQHIFFSFYDSIGAKLPVKRIWHRDMTEPELKRALENLRDENEPALKNMTIASKYRAYFDWLIGLNGTRAVTLMANKKINVGRVMTPVLKLVVDRELELRNFVPKDFWEIEADFGGKYKGLYFDHTNEEENGKAERQATRFLDKAKAERQASLFGRDGVVIEVDKKKDTQYAPGLHSLQELSNEANRAFGYTMAETLEIAQSLYEKKYLSYPRTDSAFITSAIAKEFPKYIKSVLSVPDLQEKASEVLRDTAAQQGVARNKKYVDDSKVTDHYAIIPTGATVNLGSLSEKERNIFVLVCRRFLAIFLPPLVLNKTSIVTESNGHRFKTTGSVLVDLGYMELYSYGGNDNVLPDVKKGERNDLKGVKLIAKKTSPPKRYNDETLGKAMEKAGRFVEDEELSAALGKGLGTPATRGNILDKLVKLDMVARKGSGKIKAFHACDFGVEIIQGLQGKDITLPELTATWEQKLSNIEKGEYKPADFYREMVEYVHSMMTDFKNTKVSVTNPTDKEVLGQCPKCKSAVVEAKNFYLCAKYKDTCDFLIGKEIGGCAISKTEAKKLLAGKETKEFNLTFKSGATRTSSLKINDEGKVVPSSSASGSSGSSSSGSRSSGGGERTVIGKCLKCSKQVVSTKEYYLCESYKDGCDFIQKKVLSGVTISDADMKAILSGKQTKEMEFTWNSGKTGKAKLEWKDGKIAFVFPPRT